jgi:hypothetical protein
MGISGVAATVALDAPQAWPKSKTDRLAEQARTT